MFEKEGEKAKKRLYSLVRKSSIKLPSRSKLQLNKQIEEYLLGAPTPGITKK